jgi:hypothetical protein
VYFRFLSTLTRARGVAAAGLCAGILGCADVGPTEPLTSRTQGIVSGEASGAEQDGVVLLRGELDDGSEILCSASLVEPRLLLTARHCVSYLTDGQFSCTVRGELIDNPSGGGRLGLHLPAEKLEIYGRATPRKTILAHGQQIISTLSPTICSNDLAFVVLDTALDLPLVPMRLGRPARPHEAAVLVGYGLDGTQRLLDYRSQPRAQKRNLEIEAVGPDSIADGVTTAPPRSLMLQGPSGCVGDSGGPLLSQATGAVLGVYSLQQGESCSAPDVRHRLTHVPPFQSLIEEAFAAIGGEPLGEDAPDPSAAGATSTGGAAAEAGAASDPEAGGASGGSAAGATSPPGTDAPAIHRSSCSVTVPVLATHGEPHLLAILAGAAAARRRRKPHANVVRRADP